MDYVSWHGWPQSYLLRNVTKEYDFLPPFGITTTTTRHRWHRWPLVQSIGLTLLLTAATAAMFERSRRAWNRRCQFTIRTLLTLTLVTGALALIHVRDVLDRTRLTWFEQTWIMFSVACMLYCGASILGCVASALFRLRRPTPAKVEVDGQGS